MERQKSTIGEVNPHKIASKTEWLVARKDLLKREKELTRLRDEISRHRRELPWVKVEKDYVFDAPEGKVTLAELFDGRSQLFIKHFMMGPGATHQCVGCSLEVDHVEGLLEHLENHDVSYVVVARAPIEEIEVVRKRMRWRFRWVSSYQNDFSYDFDVSFRPEDVAAGQALYNFQEAPEWAAGVEDLSGDSVFYKDESGQIFHTYSTYGRGGEQFLGMLRIPRRHAKRTKREWTLSFADGLGPAKEYVWQGRNGGGKRSISCTWLWMRHASVSPDRMPFMI
jgi:predicted dithiol-disulfide oxidoreductase (DUF899 family)